MEKFQLGKGFRNSSVSKVKTLSLSTSVCFAHFPFENSEEKIPSKLEVAPHALKVLTG